MAKQNSKSNDHGSSIKHPDQYEALRDEGMSKEKAARISNSPTTKTSQKGGNHAPYEEWTYDELYDKAQEVDIEGRSDMTKSDLIEALRNH